MKIVKAPIRHDNLKPETEARLRMVYKFLRRNPVVASVSRMDMPFADVEQNFRRDMHPEREVMVWEMMTDRMMHWLKSNPYASDSAIAERWSLIMFEVSVEHPITLVPHEKDAHDGQNRTEGRIS